MQAPVDLRRTLASSILVTGGTPMLPGFIPRLQAELLRAVSPHPNSSSPSRSPNRPGRAIRPTTYERYSSLRSLVPYFAILNHPSPPPPATPRAAASAGKAPAFSPAALAWVGGSLAGYVEIKTLHSFLHRKAINVPTHSRALKTGGIEITREKWDEAEARTNPDESMTIEPNAKTVYELVPDWTRSPLPAGAPSAVVRSQPVMVPASPTPIVT